MASKSTSAQIWILVVLVVMMGLLATSLWHESSSIAVGTSIPELDVSGWLNTEGPLTADELRGKVVLLDFWATWCFPCRANMPTMVALYRRYEKHGVVFVGLTPEDGEELRVVKPYVDSVTGLVWPIGYGAGPMINTLGVTAFPTLIVMDREGEIVWSGHDLSSAEEALIRALAS